MIECGLKLLTKTGTTTMITVVIRGSVGLHWTPAPHGTCLHATPLWLFTPLSSIVGLVVQYSSTLSLLNIYCSMASTPQLPLALTQVEKKFYTTELCCPAK